MKIGGPVYRIGVGGGAASSVQVDSEVHLLGVYVESFHRCIWLSLTLLCLCVILQVQGDNSSDRDLGAVQRGDAEMEQKMNRALRACLERAAGNPICSIHDQGAGGNGNFVILTQLNYKYEKVLSHKHFAVKSFHMVSYDLHSPLC